MGFDKNNIILQPNLTDMNNWEQPNQSIKYTLGYAGTPSKKDGIVDLLSSIEILKNKGITVSALIMGDSVGKESYLPELKQYCEKAEILSQIHFTGLISQEEVKIYLNQCQILTLTRPDTIQTQAGFPTKLGEYLASKRIVLATKFGDIERYFTDKKDMVLAETSNAHSIAENIEWILNNKSCVDTIICNGYKKANEVLNYKKGVQKILSLL